MKKILLNLLALALIAFCGRAYGADPASAYLIHQYNFDGNLDDAVGASNGVFAGGNDSTLHFIEGHDGTPNGALDFDAANNKNYMINVGRWSPVRQGVSGQMTVMFWALWYDDFNNYQDIITKRDNYDSTQMKWACDQHNGKNFAIIRKGMSAESSKKLPVGVWTHVAVTLDSVNAYFYMDGVPYDTVPYRFGSGDTAMIHIGTSASGDGSFRSGDAYNGALDDIRFYSRVLTSAEISSIFETTSGSLTLSDTALIHQYKFAGDLKDAAGSSDGIFAGGNDSTLHFINGPDGTSNGALDFDAANNKNYMINVGRWSPVRQGVSGQMTVMFWALWHGDFNNYQDIITKRDNYDSTQMKWACDQHNGKNFAIIRKGMSAESSKKLPVDEWTHVAVTLDSVNAYFYMNGVPYDTVPYRFGSGDTAMIHIGTSASGDGSYRSGDAYNGALSDVRFYSRVLSTAEINTIYNSTPHKNDTPIYVPDSNAALTSVLYGFLYVPNFDPATLTYNVELDAGTTSVNVSGKAESDSATIEGNGIVDVSSGSGTAKIVVTAEDGTTTLTYTINFTVKPSSIKNVIANSLTIYPNPVTNELFIENAGEISTAYIYNSNGQMVKSMTNINSAKMNISVDNMSSGLYLIRLVTIDNKVLNSTFIKK